MASEIRVNQIQNRSGLGTVTFNDAGLSVSGILTATTFSGNLTGNVTGTVSSSGIATFSNGIIVAAGTTAAPSISPTGDSNTGIFFPSADTIAFGEGGAEAARIDSNGCLGINTTSVSAKLQVHNNITTAYANISPTLSNVTNAWVNSSPHVSGGTFVGAQYNLPGDGQNRIAYIGAISESASDRKSSLVFGTDEGGNRTEKVRITGDGNLGIGNNNPSTKLDLLGSHSSGLITTLLKISGNAWSANGGSALEFGHDPATYPTWVTGRIASTYSGGNWGGGLKFFYNNGTTAGSLTEGMELTRDGNLAFPSGKGIDFSATANSSGTMSSELFADYEEGTWTPVDNSGASLTLGANTKGHYVRVGNVVNLFGRVVFPSTGSGSAANIGGLPFSGYFPPSADVSNGAVPSGFGYISGGSVIPQIHMSGGAAVINFYNFGTQMTNANFSGIEIRFGVTYRTS